MTRGETARNRGTGLLPWIVAVGIWLTASTLLGFWVPMPEGAFADVEGYRAAFLHIPLAWTGAVSFLVAAVQAARFLLTRNLLADAAAHAAAETGLVLMLLATITGMIFAKSQWGMWWNWDPRQTSVFFVLMLYAAYLVLRATLPEDERLRGRLSAAYLLLAVVPMVWLVAIFPRSQQAVGTLHPQKAPFERIHWIVMFVNFAGLLGLYRVLAGFHAGIARIRRTAQERQW